MYSASSRRLWAILGLSMLLHASLFVLISWQRKHAPLAVPPILASIRLINISESGQPAHARAAESAPAPAVVPQKARQTPARAEQRSVSRVPPPAGPTPASRPVPAPTAPVAAVESAPPAKVAPPVAEIAPPAAAPAAAASPARPQKELLDGYRQRLTELFARHQEYPRVAALRGWEGEVRLRLKVARKGNLVSVLLDHSSGFDVLDQHALAMLEALASLPPLPEGLEVSEIQVVVPVNYKLKKTT